MLSDIQPMYWNEVFQSGQLVGLNLAGFQAEGVMFQARLLFSFRGVSEVEVPADRIRIDR